MATKTNYEKQLQELSTLIPLPVLKSSIVFGTYLSLLQIEFQLKNYLFKTGITPKYTHDLRSLFETVKETNTADDIECQKIDQKFDALRDTLKNVFIQNRDDSGEKAPFRYYVNLRYLNFCNFESNTEELNKISISAKSISKSIELIFQNTPSLEQASK